MSSVLNKDYDVIIIGGGITGAGTARDCALRGLRVLLVEKSDFTNGATGRNHGLLHSGALFGTAGKLIVDGIGIILILLCVTGIWFWLRPRSAKVLHWHNKIGVTTLVLTIFIALTGWALRPPLMILLATHSTRPLPYTALDDDNPWHDRLRMVRYDAQQRDWMISTSEGFFLFLPMSPVGSSRSLSSFHQVLFLIILYSMS